MVITYFNKIYIGFKELSILFLIVGYILLFIIVDLSFVIYNEIYLNFYNNVSFYLKLFNIIPN